MIFVQPLLKANGAITYLVHVNGYPHRGLELTDDDFNDLFLAWRRVSYEVAEAGLTVSQTGNSGGAVNRKEPNGYRDDQEPAYDGVVDADARSDERGGPA